jgi:alpha-1,3-mannosyltransferase
MQNLFSPAECKQYTKFIDNLPLELTPPKKRGEAERVNYRFSVKSTEFAEKLHEIIAPHLPTFPYPASSRMRNTDARRSPRFLNSNIRMYKYTSDQYFGPHYDDSVRDPDTGAKSEWTLLIYLSGIDDGVQGGEVIYFVLIHNL